MRILAVIGTRPEAVKMLPLIMELKKQAQAEVLISFSNQHRTLADNILTLFKTTPDFRFEDFPENASLNEMTVALINYYDGLYKRISPDIILAHGDTTTALCASVAAFHLGIKVAHIEAGLRTHDPFSPFPEEFNRTAIDALSSICFAPTETNAENLIREGKKAVFVTGNTGIDAFKYTLRDSYTSPLLNNSSNKKLLLITTHRRESLGEKMTCALLGIRDALQSRKDVLAILPTHPNPIIQNTASQIFKSVPCINACPPLPLYDFHNILARSHLVISDSGGIQEEAAYLGIPLLLLRDNTERRECIESGNAVIIGTDRDEVYRSITDALDDENILKNMRKGSLAFGDGSASEKIAKNLLFLLEKDDIIK